MTLKPLLCGISLSLAAASASAATVDVKVLNLTQGMAFTPILVAAHKTEYRMFQVGTKATDALASMAEGGSVEPLEAEVKTANGVSTRSNGLLMPTKYFEAKDFDTNDNGYLSIGAMMLPTNDGFIGLDSWKIPTAAGTYTLYLNGYDAGSEANDERIVGAMAGGPLGSPGIPAAPTGMAGTGGTGLTDDSPNENVHIHPGNIGDTDLTGGKSDVNALIHRWLNPVAKVVVTVK